MTGALPTRLPATVSGSLPARVMSGGRADDYAFEAGYTYNFTVYLLGQNDATDVEIIPGGGVTPTPRTSHPRTRRQHRLGLRNRSLR